MLTMNKIKAQLTIDDFSPWEESFMDVFQTMEIAKKRKSLGGQFRTLEPIKNAFRKESSKQIMNKTLLSVSKINLHNTNQSFFMQPEKQNYSKRYAGPRVTFYSKMNPRINERSKSCLDPTNPENQDREETNKQLTSRMLRDQSIKYLQIIEEKDYNEDKRRKANSYIIPRSLNLNRVKAMKSPKNDEHLLCLQRLKMIYNTRKH